MFHVILKLMKLIMICFKILIICSLFPLKLLSGFFIMAQKFEIKKLPMKLTLHFVIMLVNN